MSTLPKHLTIDEVACTDGSEIQAIADNGALVIDEVFMPTRYRPLFDEMVRRYNEHEALREQVATLTAERDAARRDSGHETYVRLLDRFRAQQADNARHLAAIETLRAPPTVDVSLDDFLADEDEEAAHWLARLRAEQAARRIVTALINGFRVSGPKGLQ